MSRRKQTKNIYTFPNTRTETNKVHRSPVWTVANIITNKES
jgi:hypothetical protein